MLDSETENKESYWTELFAFLTGLGFAWLFNWQTGDLVWSFWLCSLVLGYMTILSAIAGGVFLGVSVISHPQLPADKKQPVMILVVCVALFLFWFFSLHFCAFHAGHATFLNKFFPLKTGGASFITESIVNPLAVWIGAVKYVLPVYGVMLVPILVVDRYKIFSAFINYYELAKHISRTDVKKLEAKWLTDYLSKGKAKQVLFSPFTGPYINVLKMHILILVLGVSSAAGFDNFIFFAAVYAVYFFPWRIFNRKKDNLS